MMIIYILAIMIKYRSNDDNFVCHIHVHLVQCNTHIILKNITGWPTIKKAKLFPIYFINNNAKIFLNLQMRQVCHLNRFECNRIVTVCVTNYIIMCLLLTLRQAHL